MRKIVLISLVAVVCLTAIWTMNNSHEASAPEQAQSTVASPAPQAVESAKAALRDEPKIKDFTYDPNAAVQWQIGVIDDGTSRVGYANYICELLAEHGVSNDRTQVRIVDIVKVSAGKNFRSASLGHVACADRRVIVP